jgi:poly(ADP-ribose) glycohydrolase ARH3
MLARVPPTRDQFTGCLLGLALGDALGAPYEGGPIEGAFWRMLGKTKSGERRYTDDTQMSLDLAESLLARGTLDPDDLAARFAAGFHWSRGYGPGAARVLKRIRNGTHWEVASRSVYPEGSFGNGAAMRAPVVGMAYWDDGPRLLEATRASARITHAHPLGIEGAVLIARASSAALVTRDWSGIFDSARAGVASAPFLERLSLASSWLGGGAAPGPDEVSERLGMGITATESCPTAVYVALRFLDAPFEQLLDFVADCGGDVDTVGAMAGAIWGARNGESQLPSDLLSQIEGRARIAATAGRLHEALVLAR